MTKTTVALAFLAALGAIKLVFEVIKLSFDVVDKLGPHVKSAYYSLKAKLSRTKAPPAKKDSLEVNDNEAYVDSILHVAELPDLPIRRTLISQLQFGQKTRKQVFLDVADFQRRPYQ
jgi:hypothetical protein